MPDVRTNIKITSDDSGVRKLGTALAKTFDKKSARELALTVRGLQQQFNTTAATVARLTTELVKAKKGTEAYKALTQQLKDATTQAGQLQRALGQIEQITSRQDRAERQRKNEGRRSFVGGMAQGLGIAQYMPAEPGQGRRIAGAMLGGAMRRGMGGAAAPFLMPGMGGLSQMAGSVPVVGGALSGALSTAAGAYQTAVGFDRARWQALSFMGTSGGRRFRLGPSSEATEDLQTAGAANKAAQQQFRSAQQAQNLAERNEKIARDTHFRAKNRQEARALRQQGTLQKLQDMSGGAPGAFAQAGGAGVASYEGAVKGLARRQTEDAKAQTREARLAAEDAARELANAKERASKPRFGVAAGLPGAGAGIEFGLGPTQMMGMFTEFMKARGGIYDKAGEGQFRTSMAAAARSGISTSTAGQFARMGLAGGGGGGQQNLAEVLANAYAQKLDGSQVAEYLQTLVGLGQQAERTGVKIDTLSFTRGAGLLTGAGLEGLQAQRVAGGMQQSSMRLSAQGVSGPMDVLMARAAGFDPSQGPEGYARAMNKLAGGMTPDMMNNLMGTLTTGVQGSDFGPEMQALMFRRAMQKMGVQVGPGQASTLLDSYKRSGGKLPSGVTELWASGEAPGAEDDLRREARRRVSIGAGLTKGAAGLEAMQVGLGRGAAGFVVGAEKNQLKFALSIVNNFGDGLGKLNAVVLKAIKGFDKLLEAMELGAGFSNLVGTLPGGSPVKKPGAPTPAGKAGKRRGK